MTNRMIPIAMLTSIMTYGCAITPDDTRKTSKARQAHAQLVCRKEKKTGSLRPVQVCRPKEASALDQENTQRDVRRIMRQSEYQEIGT